MTIPNSLVAANAQTSVPQSPQSTPAAAAAPVMTSPAKVANQVSNLQSSGMGKAQAVNKAAINPNNRLAKGGVPAPSSPHPDETTNPPSSKSVDVIAKALEGSAAMKDDTPKSTSMEDMLQQYDTPQGKQYLQDRTKMAKGGEVAPNEDKIKNMSLKQVMQLLATHPGLAKQEGLDSTAQGGQTSMRTGGSVLKKAHGMTLQNPATNTMDMNVDTGTYKTGGLVGKVKMDAGGGLQGGPLEADSTVQYGPDGTPIVQNADGSESEGDVDQLLDRPDSASTLGTGQDPRNAISQNAANIIPSQAPAPQGLAKGGEEKGTPPGSLKDEVADNIPAQLSEGEFVMSADSTRFWGLQKLTAMQDFARQELARMQNEGSIRSPGDGKNPDQSGGQGLTGKFMQDDKPDDNFYSPDEKGQAQPPAKSALPEAPDQDDMKTGGILKRAKGGMCYSTGGGVFEEDSYARGGVVSPNASSLTPKGNEGKIPVEAPKVKTIAQPSAPKAPPLTNKTATMPKPTGILRSMALKQTDKNMARNINQTQSYIA